MLNEALGRRYAEALFQIVEGKGLDQAESDLIALVQLTEEHEDVGHILNHPHIPVSEKKALMEKLMGDDTSVLIKNFLYLLIDRRRQSLLPSVLKAFRIMADEARQIIEAKVISVTALSADQETKLQQALVRATGKNVRVLSEQNLDLIGGIKVQVGDRVWDGTIVHALDRMRKELLKSAMV
ncbi:MAG: F0F1 ATP synthase subunit delta [Peptococcaceae bacterium]|jgi:F-type H+-transporting ATPase subunit delta|nr:F0F1 ATP synthase subunit delta [Peptococcaceae bacterium]